MRGVAALLVAFFHLRFGIMGVPLLDYHVFSIRFGNRGYLWVDFFFILSGFILAYRYRDACMKLNLRIYGDFIRHRFARIWPLNLVTVALAILYLGLKNGAGFLSAKAIIANVLLVHGWGWYFPPPLDFPSWSLSGEWGAYLVLPLYLFLIARIRGGVVHLLIVAGLFLLLAWYAARFGHGTLDLLRERWGLGRCLIEVGIGVGLFQLHDLIHLRRIAGMGKTAVKTAKLFDAAAAASFAAIFFIFTYTTNDLSFVPLAAALIFCLSLAEGIFSHMLSWRPIVVLGEISFSVYMLHAFVLWLMQDVPISFKSRLGFDFGALYLLAAHLLVLALAYLSFQWIEKPGREVVLGRWPVRQRRSS